MKLLRELVKEKALELADVGKNNVQELKDIVNTRLQADPALRDLVLNSADSILFMSQIQGLPGRDTLSIVLAMNIIAWERANEAFNNQLTNK